MSFLTHVIKFFFRSTHRENSSTLIDISAGADEEFCLFFRQFSILAFIFFDDIQEARDM